MRRVLAGLAALALPAAAQLPSPIAEYRPAVRIDLPAELIEVSGLVAVNDHTVLAHGDELAVVYAIDIRSGSVTEAFRLGSTPLRRDVEAITVTPNATWLATSEGILFEVPGGGGTMPAHASHDTGLGDTCEIEGMTTDGRGGLLLVCKQVGKKKKPARLLIHRWDIAAAALDPEPWADLPAEAFLPGREVRTDDLAWAGIERDPRTGGYLVVASQGRLILALDAEGRPVGTMPLAKKGHPQSEGIAIMPDGTLVIADEGQKKSQGRLTVYAPLGLD